MDTAEANGQVTVVIADDHPMLRWAITTACEDAGIWVQAQVGDGEEAVQACLEFVPDVLLLDLMMPKMDGFEVARKLKEEGCPTKILVFTARDDATALLESIRAAVDGFIDKATALESIDESIKAVAAGTRVFTPEQEKAALEQFGRYVKQSRERSRVEAVLTDREMEVLALIGEAMTTIQIASRLSMSPRTVESHIKKLYRKLDVKSRVQAVARADELGLLPQGHSS